MGDVYCISKGIAGYIKPVISCPCWQSMFQSTWEEDRWKDTIACMQHLLLIVAYDIAPTSSYSKCLSFMWYSYLEDVLIQILLFQLIHGCSSKEINKVENWIRHDLNHVIPSTWLNLNVAPWCMLFQYFLKKIKCVGAVTGRINRVGQKRTWILCAFQS